MFRRIWNYVSGNPLAATLVGTVLGTVLATWLVAWRWSDVKPYLAPLQAAVGSVTDWLAAPAQVTHSTLLLSLALTAGVAALIGSVAINRLQARARAAGHRQGGPQGEPRAAPQAPAKVDAGGFEWTDARARMLTTLSDHYGRQVDIDELFHLVCDTAPPIPLSGGRAQIAREMEAAERAGIVDIELMADGFGYYRLTQAGRDWLLEQLEEERNAVQRARTGATATPQGTPKAPLRFDAESFELTPVRCRALLALLRRMEARTTLFQLHEMVVDDDDYIDPDISNAQVQHDMEAAERAGIVNIERVPGGTAHYYALAVPDGRDWVLKKERALKGAAHLGMKRKPTPPRYS